MARDVELAASNVPSGHPAFLTTVPVCTQLL